jgi:hypothetical protein
VGELGIGQSLSLRFGGQRRCYVLGTRKQLYKTIAMIPAVIAMPQMQMHLVQEVLPENVRRAYRQAIACAVTLRLDPAPVHLT